MTVKFVSYNGVAYRVLHTGEGGMWLISYEEPAQPFFYTGDGLERIQTPEGFLEQSSRKKLTAAQQSRLALIQPLLDAQPRSITDRSYRLSLAKEIAREQGTTYKRVLRLYYRYLAQGVLTSPKNCGGRESRPEFDWAIKTFYFSAKKFSLRATYAMMVVERFTSWDGTLLDTTPSWSAFRHYFYNRGYHRQPQKVIARDGLAHYQRSNRPAFGTASQWKPEPGAFQMDATVGDIYLVSRLDRSVVLGRPNIYLAVDTTTQLIAGLYVGMDSDETAVMKCLECAAMDKRLFCKQFNVTINWEQWPNTGLPNEIITDRGREFFGPRVGELCRRYGVEVESLPPFRPDRKGLVEKAFDLLQQRYKPLLRGKGVIEPDAQERWTVDYRDQAVLDLDEFTAVLIHCITYLNSGRLLSDGRTAAWRWIEGGVKLLTPPISELHPLTLPRVTAKLTRKGLKVNGLWYAPREANGLFIGDSYTVAYDPADVGSVFLIMDDGPIPCPITKTAATTQYEGRSTQEVIQDQARQRTIHKEAEQTERQAGVAAVRAIQGIVKQAQGRDST